MISGIAWDRLGRRRQAFRTLIDELPIGCRIVETGTIRQIGNWEGDGQSTIVWSVAASLLDGHVDTIDIDEVGRAIVSVTSLPRVTAHTGDSLTVLPTLTGIADLLYLDSFDVDFSDPEPAAAHHLAELHAAAHLLRPGSIVAVDDNHDDVGKGQHVATHLADMGATEIVSGYVRAWRLP